MTSKTRSLWPVDWCHILFLTGSTALLLIYRHLIPDVWGWVGLNLVLLAAVWASHVWSRGRGEKNHSVIKMVAVVTVIPIVFTQLGWLVPYVNPAPWETRLAAVDAWIFGGTNPLLWLDRCTHPFLTEVLQWIYNFYYFIPIILGCAVVREGRPRDLGRMLFFMSFCIYLSYIGYYLVPATGPNIDQERIYEFSQPVTGIFLTRELRDTLFAIEKIKQNCFPSGHTAVSLLSLMLAWRFARRAVPVLVPLVAALIFSTMYLRYHYVADVLAGIVLALVSYYGGWIIHRAFERRIGWEPT